jgi:hypothetical protein
MYIYGYRVLPPNIGFAVHVQILNYPPKSGRTGRVPSVLNPKRWPEDA